MRPQPLCDVAWPLPVVRAASRVELRSPSLDVPSLQDEEVDDSASHFVSASPRVIVQEIPDVSMPSSCERALQPLDTEPVLDVPALREIDHDFKLSSVLTWLALALAHEAPEVQVLPQARVDSLQDAQEQVIVRESPELQVTHVQSGRLGEQVVDVPVRGGGPRAAVSGRSVKQMVDVPVRGRIPRAAVSGISVEEMVDVPVRGRIPCAAVSGRSVEQTVDVPVETFRASETGTEKVQNFLADLDPCICVRALRRLNGM